MAQRKKYVFPANRESLEDYYDMTLSCYKCGYCKYVWPSRIQHDKFTGQCPSGEKYQFESYYASGRMEVVRGIIEGHLKWTDRLNHILYTCTMCGACDESCGQVERVYPTDVILEARRTAVKEGQILPGHQQLAKSVSKHHNLYESDHADRNKWAKGLADVKSRSKIIYFAGCTTESLKPSIAKSTSKLLKSLGVEFGILPDGWCCGMPLFDTGQTDDGIKTLKHNIEQIRDTGAETVIFSDAWCYKAFRDSKDYGIELGFKVLHLTEFLAPYLAKGNLKFDRGTDETVTYQDPCYLSRYFEVYEQPRDLIKSVKGVTLKEMYRSRRESFCCGAAGGVKFQFPEVTEHASSTRIDEAKHAGLSKIVTACPSCQISLEDAGKDQGMEIYDIAEYLSEGLKKTKK